ncbi:hypothetical protein C1645_869986 [Glomus cerebriforme]|uniref:F-box domain-containing protein n=1 Tax=Glomus cerebriforme TaxID=658196 RepID=A0A397TS12_9GLOM|nr:hypothetical protein C1645_869986 [Glomus cerebriforme]
MDDKLETKDVEMKKNDDADLFTLTQVCRKFRGYLCAPNSLATQQIWKESRLQFIPNEDLPPPEGMSEEKYVELLMMERGCQICKRNKICKIYWEFAIRCCSSCHLNKTICRNKLIRASNCPLEFVNVMPFTKDTDFSCEYNWIEQIDHAYSQYYGLSKENKKFWLDDKKHVFDSIMEYSKKRVLREKKSDWSFLLYFSLCSHCDFHFQLFLYRHFPPSPPLSKYLEDFDDTFQSTKILEIPPPFFLEQNESKAEDIPIPQLIQLHIQRLENELQQSTFNVGVSLANNYNENSNKPKGNNFIKTKKKKNKREFHNRFNKLNMKGKNSKNKFAYKYG